MDKKSIGQTLRRLRNENGMRPEDVGALLGLSGKTISGYESGQRQPDAETFLRLCDIYHVSDVMSEFFGRSSGFALSAREIELVKAYRSTPSRQDAVDCLLNIESAGANKKHA